MGNTKGSRLEKARRKRLGEAIEILGALGFGGRQRNDGAGYTLLALLDLTPQQVWSEATAVLRGITPIIEFIGQEYGLQYAPNTRETIRDEAVKHFVESGMLVRNPDDPKRPTNSGNTVHQIEPHALELFHSYGTPNWPKNLESYLKGREGIRDELARTRNIARIPISLPSGLTVAISPGGQNPLIKAVVEEFLPRFAPTCSVLYIGDAENKFLHLDVTYLGDLGVTVPAPSKMPDLVVHDTKRNWLLLIEAVTSVGPVDGKRRKELKELFKGCNAGLVFVTAFTSREAMRSFLPHISWESEVWTADSPDHLIHFDGERFLGPYPDVYPE